MNINKFNCIEEMQKREVGDTLDCGQCWTDVQKKIDMELAIEEKVESLIEEIKTQGKPYFLKKMIRKEFDKIEHRGFTELCLVDIYDEAVIFLSIEATKRILRDDIEKMC